MGPPFRLLEVVPYYEPAWAFGGPPRVMSEEAKELARRGHDVTVFTTDAFERSERLASGQCVESGVAVHRFRNLSNRLAFDRYRFQPVGMRKRLREVDADVVHLSELRHELAVLTWQACRRRRIPLVVSAHGTLPRRGGWKGRVRAQYDRLFVDPMLDGAAAVIAQTTHEAELYRSYGVDAERVHLVPLGVQTPPAAGAGPTVELGVPEGARYVLFLGRIHPLKGVERLVTAFAQVVEEIDDVWLVVAGRDDGGEGAARSLATTLGIGGRVSFPGPIYGDARFDVYRGAAVFAITPVHFEETSLASLEAAAVGTPLLLSEEAEAPFLDEYGAGRTVAAGVDPGTALVDLLESDLGVAGANAARMVAERHAWAPVGGVLEQLFGAVS